MTYGGSKVDRVCTSVNLNSGYGKVAYGIHRWRMKKLVKLNEFNALSNTVAHFLCIFFIVLLVE